MPSHVARRGQALVPPRRRRLTGLPFGPLPCYSIARTAAGRGGIPIMTTEATADAPPRPEFLALGGFYKSELEPWLEAHEGRRRKARLLRWLIIGGGLAMLAGWLYYLLAWADSPDDFWFGAIFFLAIGVVIVGNLPLMSLKADVKQFVMDRLAAFFKFTYEAKPDFGALALFRDLELLPYHSSASFEDGLKGEIKGVPFQMVEARLTERRGTGKSAKTVTVFRGLLVDLPCPPAAAVAVWRRENARWTDDPEWREVTLGDPGFDRAYAVHAADAGTAHRLLDADARRVFAALDRRDDVDNVRLGLKEGHLLIVVERGADSFEAGNMNRPLADPDRVQDMVELFAIPFDAVDGFKLQPATAAPTASRGGAVAQRGA